MAEAHVYHLQRQPLEAVLPLLLQRSLDRGWRALVRAGSEERVRALDDHLWSFSEESFLPHGTERDPEAAEQPVLLATADTNLNGAAMLFLVDGAAVPQDIGGFQRVALLLDGRDESAVAAGRSFWRDMKAAGHDLAYWQQDEAGRWGRKA